MSKPRTTRNVSLVITAADASGKSSTSVTIWPSQRKYPYWSSVLAVQASKWTSPGQADAAAHERLEQPVCVPLR